MPSFPTKRAYTSSKRERSADPEPGTYLTVLVEFPEQPITTANGVRYYLLRFECVEGRCSHDKFAFFIRSDISGLPTLEWAGEGRWREMLHAFGLHESNVASINTSDLLYRPCRFKVERKNGKVWSGLEACTNEEAETCLDFANRFYPLKE